MCESLTERDSYTSLTLLLHSGFTVTKQTFCFAFNLKLVFGLRVSAAMFEVSPIGFILFSLIVFIYMGLVVASGSV